MIAMITWPCFPALRPDGKEGVPEVMEPEAVMPSFMPNMAAEAVDLSLIMITFGCYFQSTNGITKMETKSNSPTAKSATKPDVEPATLRAIVI